MPPPSQPAPPRVVEGAAPRDPRRAGRVPAVLYGHGQDVVHLSLPAREFAAALRNGGSNALLTVVLDGKEQLDRKSTRLNSSPRQYLVCRLLLEKKKNYRQTIAL